MDIATAAFGLTAVAVWAAGIGATLFADTFEPDEA